MAWGAKTLACAGLCLVLAHTAPGCRKASQADRVTINGRTWQVELATTAQQRYQGLSGRRSLDDSGGMLFVYRRPKVLEFCMRDCHIPLDIAFITSDMRVTKVYTMAVEPDLAGRAVYSSQVPAQYALEVSAGSLQRAQVKVGDKVSFSGSIVERAKGQADP